MEVELIKFLYSIMSFFPSTSIHATLISDIRPCQKKGLYQRRLRPFHSVIKVRPCGGLSDTDAP